jgi:hypothetical protein
MNCKKTGTDNKQCFNDLEDLLLHPYITHRIHPIRLGRQQKGKYDNLPICWCSWTKKNSFVPWKKLK